MITKQQIKYIRSLHQKKYRDLYRTFLAEGIKVVKEVLLLAPHTVHSVVYTSGTDFRIRDAVLLPDTRILEISPDLFKSLSTLKSPQGIMAVVRYTEPPFPDSGITDDLILVLDSVRDPGNLGTLIRLADWFGINHIICSEDTVDCYNPKVIQATMGAFLRVSVHYCALADYLGQLKRSGTHTLYGTTLAGENLFAVNVCTPAVIVLGNEAQGISQALLNYMDSTIRIPDFNTSDARSESLNVSVAAGIICAEFRRQMNSDRYSK